MNDDALLLLFCDFVRPEDETLPSQESIVEHHNPFHISFGFPPSFRIIKQRWIWQRWSYYYTDRPLFLCCIAWITRWFGKLQPRLFPRLLSLLIRLFKQTQAVHHLIKVLYWCTSLKFLRWWCKTCLFERLSFLECYVWKLQAFFNNWL